MYCDVAGGYDCRLGEHHVEGFCTVQIQVPLLSLSYTTMSISCYSSVSVSAMTIMTSQYDKLLITLSPILMPPFPSMLLMIISVCNANR